MMAKPPMLTTEMHPKTLLLGIFTPYNRMRDMDAYFEEFLSLVKALGVSYDETLFMKVRSVDKANFFTKGKLQDLQNYCQKHEIEEIICSEVLSPLQERNLYDLLNCRIMDRSQLILDIFHSSAHTAEGKTQVEIATLEYLKTRLAGKGLELAQQAGFIGTRGPGETLKEATRRYYETKIRQAKKRLKALEQARHIQRKQRLQSGIPLISLIGYTNAGKSSILNRLTKSEVLVEDKLFATLDTTTRLLYLGDDKKALLSDTVGFISELPHHLIEAFKATLDELQYADLLLFVVDISNPLWQGHIKVVHEILDELHVKSSLLYVFNKIDKRDNLDTIFSAIERFQYQPHVLISAQTKEGIEPLLTYLQHYRFAKQAR